MLGQPLASNICNLYKIVIYNYASFAYRYIVGSDISVPTVVDTQAAQTQTQTKGKPNESIPPSLECTYTHIWDRLEFPALMLACRHATFTVFLCVRW